MVDLNATPVAGSGSGLVVGWEQQTGTLLASGDVRFIRVWDTHREMRMQVSVSMTRIRESSFMCVHACVCLVLLLHLKIAVVLV